ncbi:putative tetracycline-efflux transporter, partial [Aureobasidium melanogenum]
MFGPGDDDCGIAEVQSRVAKLQTGINLTSGLLAAVVTPYLGRLSDIWGRKALITITSLGSIINEVLFIVVDRNVNTISARWLFLGAFFDGISGSFMAAMALSYSYVSDCTSPALRNSAFGYLDATYSIGLALGPTLISHLDLRLGIPTLPFYIALGCHVLYVVFLICFVPESLSQERQTLARQARDLKKSSWQSSISELNPLKLIAAVKSHEPDRPDAYLRNLILLALADTVYFGISVGTTNIIILYGGFVFGWSDVEISGFISATCICRICALLLILPSLNFLLRHESSAPHTSGGRVDTIDLYQVRGALFLSVLGYSGYAIAPSGAAMLVSGMVAALGDISSPSLQSSLTKQMPEEYTGQLLGVMGQLHALSRIAIPTMMNMIYAKLVGIFPQGVFLCLTAGMVLAKGCTWFIGS